MRLAMILAQATAGLAVELSSPGLVSGLGEPCNGFNESTGQRFPDCEQGLLCRDAGLVTIPGAGSTCQKA